MILMDEKLALFLLYNWSTKQLKEEFFYGLINR